MPSETTGERGVAIDGDVHDATIVTGDNNVITVVAPKPRAPTRLTRATWRKWLREHTTPTRVLAAVVALIGVVSGVIVIAQFVQPLTRPQAVMTGGLNVAIAEFGGLDAQQREVDLPANATLATDVYKVLGDELTHPIPGKVPPSVQVWSPSQTGRIRGQTPEQRAAAAEKRANEINADLLVYGEVVSSATGSTLQPRFYFGARKLKDAEELTGTHDFGGAIVSDGDLTNTATSQRLGDRLLPRIRALAQFVLGLDQFQISQFDEAEQYFDAAANQGWPDGAGKEVLFLFQGNAAGRQNDLDAAQRYYEQALGQQRAYPRAQLGLAEVLFQRSGASVDCDPSRVNVADLRAAIGQFQAAATTAGPSNMRTKANLALGHGYACLSLAQDQEDHWPDAQQAFKNVIADYESRGPDTRDQVRDTAAEAHAGLGLVLLPSADDPPGQARDDAYRASAQEYQGAVDLTGHSDRRAVFYRLLGHIHTRLNQPEQADADYAQAAANDPPNAAFYNDLRRQLKSQ